MSALPYFDSLLPPLWDISVSYLDRAERWFYADVFPCLTHPKDRLDLLKEELESARWDVFQDAVAGNHIYILDALNMLGVRFSPVVVYEAVVLDRAEIMKWLVKTHPLLVIAYYDDRNVTSAEAGAVGVLMWENKTRIKPWTSNTCAVLAKHNKFEALRLLRDQSAPWDHSTYESAVSSGNVEMVKWIEKTDPSIAFVSDNVLENIGMKAMLDHFIDRNIGFLNPRTFVERLIYRCRNDLFRFVLERRVFDAYFEADRVVVWVLQKTASLKKAKIAIDYGYPLPGLDVADSDDFIGNSTFLVARIVIRKLRELGWRG